MSGAMLSFSCIISSISYNVLNYILLLNPFHKWGKIKCIENNLLLVTKRGHELVMPDTQSLKHFISSICYLIT